MGLGEEARMSTSMAVEPGLSIPEYEAGSAHTDRLAA